MSQSQPTRQDTFDVPSMFRAAVLLAAAVGLIILAVTILRTNPERVDLEVILTSIGHLQRGEVIYSTSGVFGSGADLTKPPLILLLWAPLASIPWELLAGVWPVLTVLGTAVVVMPFSIEAWALGFVLSFHSIFAEVLFGQYNLLALAPVVIARACAMPALLGMLTGVMLLEKPTLLPLVIWAWSPYLPRQLRFSLDRSRCALLAGFLGFLGLVSAVFAGSFGLAQLIEQHRAWWAHLQLSENFYILRLENLGVPAMIGRHMGHSIPGFSSILILLSLTALLMFRWKRPADDQSLFGWCAAAFLALSPMTWRQNFIVLVPVLAPFCISLFRDLETKPWNTVLLAPSVVAIASLSVLMNLRIRAILGIELLHTAARWGVPLWLSLGIIWFATRTYAPERQPRA